MKKIKSLDALEAENSKSFAVTIGNFDGFHRGHASLLSQIKKKCQKYKLELIVITFKPHPRTVLSPATDNFLLTSYKQKEKLISNLGIDYYMEIPFDRDFSTLNPKEFLDRYIFTESNIKMLYLGHDFSFGQGKKGDFNFVRNYCRQKAVNAEVQDKFLYNNQRVSSSLIRSFIHDGEIEGANDLLGREFLLDGIVIKGEGRGRKIGFPTANIFIEDVRAIPGNGVYITRTIQGGMLYDSVTNIGHNPTFSQAKRTNVETYIFDFDRDIYGEEIEVLFYKKIREEKKFNSVNELISQISKDVEEAKKFFYEKI